MGVCPAGASAQPIMPPGTFGGNMDTRQLTRGTTLYLPVEVAARSSAAATPMPPRATARCA
jgi:acetamidase/formamidase